MATYYKWLYGNTAASHVANVRRRIWISNFTILFLLIMALVCADQFHMWFLADTYATHVNTSYACCTDDILRTSQNNTSTDISYACEFPIINPFEPSVMKIAGIRENAVECEESSMPDFTYVTDSNELTINSSKVEEYMSASYFLYCRYRHIIHDVKGDAYFQYSKWSVPFKDKITLPKHTEFIMVECRNTKFELLSKKFFCLIPRHEQFNEMDFINLKKRQDTTSPKETLNIIMIGIDMFSSNNFLRACKKTYSYLMNSLQSFDLLMHSQLGTDTLTNFLPLFSGLSYNEVSKWWSDGHNLDNLELLWHTFETAGYRTLFTENWPGIGMFNYEKKGFRIPFARYNTQPFTTAMHKDMIQLKNRTDCSKKHVDIDMLLDYISRFLDKFQSKPVFAVAMFNKPPDASPTGDNKFDEHLLNFYQSLEEKGHLNNTVLVTFSNRGVGWGPLRDSVNGFVESRTPLTIMTFPEWFLRKYPDVDDNMKSNTRRLTTHFDTHATLLDLLYFKPDTPPTLAPLRHGSSLLGRIPWDRTCKAAHIPSELCLCSYAGLEDLNVTSSLSTMLADLVVIALNSKIDKSICAVLSLHHIIRVFKIEINYDSNKKDNKIVYQVKLQTSPGNAIFEASVYSERNFTNLTVGNNIERLNLYRGQADCVKIALYKPFCYCNSFISG